VFSCVETADRLGIDIRKYVHYGQTHFVLLWPLSSMSVVHAHFTVRLLGFPVSITELLGLLWFAGHYLKKFSLITLRSTVFW